MSLPIKKWARQATLLDDAVSPTATLAALNDQLTGTELITGS